jgi:hypothetical protein
MPFVDYTAADRIRELREDRGLSNEALANAIKRYALEQDWAKVHGTVDPFTLRRIEHDGHCPSERVRVVIALFFEVRPRDIWRRENRREVENDGRRKATA